MKIQLMSDMHCIETTMDKIISGEFIEVDGDILILAGDMYEIRQRNLPKVIEFFDWVYANYRFVIQVNGNHEYYHETWEPPQGITEVVPYTHWVLENESIMINGVIFYGGTMWSHIPESSANVVRRSLADYTYIKGFTTDISAERSVKFTAGLVDVLVHNPDSEVVVISHHVPSYELTEPMYVGSSINPGFHNECGVLLEQYNNQIKLWCHGHSHGFMDKVVNGVRCVRNPIGYFKSEWDSFDPTLTIEI